MKLLLDQGLARTTVHHLHAIGIEAVHVGEMGLAAASDAAILDIARQEERIVVTLDADFHALLALSGADIVGQARDRYRTQRGGQRRSETDEIGAPSPRPISATRRTDNRRNHLGPRASRRSRIRRSGCGYRGSGRIKRRAGWPAGDCALLLPRDSAP